MVGAQPNDTRSCRSRETTVRRCPMTTGPFAKPPLVFGHELHVELVRTRAIILALLATLCVALVAPSAPRADRLLAATSAQSNADLPIRKPSVSESLSANQAIT